MSAIRPWRPGSGQLQDASFGQAGPAVRKAYPPTRRMTASQLARYLGRRTYALASSTRPDGRAHAAPTLFTLYASAFWLPTIDGAARLGMATRPVSAANAATSITPAAIPAVVRTSVKPNRPVHNDSR